MLSLNKYSLIEPMLFIRLFQIGSVFSGLLFILFYFFLSEEVENASIGHLYLFGVVFFLSLLGLYTVKYWAVHITDDVIEIRYPFKKNKQITFSKIDNVQLGQEEQLKIYMDNKKILTIYALTVNYDLFLSDLKKNHIIINSASKK
jgi:ABC-type transport system involved in multi-copper enzyme maturation permease subunit